MLVINGNSGGSAVLIDGHAGGGVSIDAGALSEVDFNLVTYVDVEVSGGNPGSQVTIEDILFDSVTSSTIITDGHLVATGDLAFTFESLDTGIGTVTENGEVDWVANGVARILCKGTKCWKRQNVTVSKATGQTTNRFNSYIAGSAAKHCTDAIDSAIAGKTLITNGLLFSSMDHVNAIYVRNSNCWLNLLGIDCTGIGVWNDIGNYGLGSQNRHGTVLHNQIAIFAAHYNPSCPIGTKVRFVTADNIAVDRIVEAVLQPVGDMYLVRFSEALPASIHVNKVLPSNWSTYFPSVAIGAESAKYSIPVLSTDQTKGGYIQNWMTEVSLAEGFVKPTDAQRLLFTKLYISGDSGAPRALIINGELAVLSSHSSQSLVQYLTDLDAGINTLVPGAATTKINLSGFTAF
jgi:hypothetical protein